MQLACQWNLAHPAVECVAPTLIQEAARRRGRSRTSAPSSAALPAEQRLGADDVDEIRAIGDNTGCMALKGANPEHEGEEQPDRWPLDRRAGGRRRRWGIDPERDLVARPSSRLAAVPIVFAAVQGRDGAALVDPRRGLLRALPPDARLDRGRAGADRDQHDVGASAAGLQWVMNAYLLMIAVFVVTAGRLGDMFGRKGVFLARHRRLRRRLGLSGAAGDRSMLVVGRVVQGPGAAAMLPLSLAIVCDAFPAERAAEGAGDLGRGLGAGAGDRAAGRRAPGRTRLAGDLLDQPAGGGARVRDHGEGRPRVDRPRRRHMDRLAGAGGAQRRHHRGRPGARPVASWGGRGDRSAWPRRPRSPAAFGAIEHRVADPIVDFALFRNGPYFGASAAAFALVGAYWAVMFFQPQYLQDVRGHSPIAAGLLILPITVPMVFFSPFSGRLIARFGARGLMTAGMLCGLAGVLVLTRIEVDSPYALLLAGYLLFGIALGLVYAPMSTAAMAAMPAEKAGIASGVLAMDRVLAGAVALAVSGAVFHALLGDGAAPSPTRSPARPGSWSASRGRRRAHLGLRARPRTARTDPRSPATAAEQLRHHRITANSTLAERDHMSSLTKLIPSCPHGIRRTAARIGVCHHRRDVVAARG